MKNILIVDDDDDDINSSLKYKKWIEDEGIFNLTLLNDPLLIESHLKSNKTYDLILIGLKISMMNGLNLYDKINKYYQQKR
jgi:DNA-binding NtrC family response regulator